MICQMQFLSVFPHQNKLNLSHIIIQQLSHYQSWLCLSDLFHLIVVLILGTAPNTASSRKRTSLKNCMQGQGA